MRSSRPSPGIARNGASTPSFAEALHKLMRERDLTQERLGELVGVSQAAISNMLNRDCRPQRKTIEKFAEALGVSPRSLWPNYDV